jgi:hypothetical protein
MGFGLKFIHILFFIYFFLFYFFVVVCLFVAVGQSCIDELAQGVVARQEADARFEGKISNFKKKKFFFLTFF